MSEKIEGPKRRNESTVPKDSTSKNYDEMKKDRER